MCESRGQLLSHFYHFKLLLIIMEHGLHAGLAPDISVPEANQFGSPPGIVVC